jgi:hypothetical protein
MIDLYFGIRASKAFAFLLVVAATVAPSAFAQVPGTVTFDGFDLKSGKIIFKGETITEVTAERVSETVRYWDPEGTETQQLKAGYDRATLMPTHYRRDYLLTGEWEALEREGKTATVKWQAKGKKTPETFEVDWGEYHSISVVVLPQIRKHRDTLKAGKEVVLELVVPSRQDVYDFRLRLDKPLTIDGKPTWVIRMEPDSFLIRQLVDPLYFYFSDDGADTLVEYRGRTSVQNEAGDGVDARIVYTYPTR